MTNLPLRATEDRRKKIDEKLLFGQVHVADSLDLLHDCKVLLREIERLRKMLVFIRDNCQEVAALVTAALHPEEGK